MKTLQEQYNLIKEGKGHKDIFTKEAKRLFPNIVPNAATFNQTAKLLKQRSVISENIFPLMPSQGLNPFTSFDKFIAEEAKATESKTTKEVNEKETTGYDYKNPKNLDNQIFDQYIKGLRFEMEQDPELLADEPTEAMLKAKEIVLKNLEKDPIYYTKNAAFGIKDVGYTELENGKEPTGKYKSSGYGDLKENKMDSLNNFRKFLLTEAVKDADRHPFTDILYKGVDGNDKNQAYVLSALKDGTFYWIAGKGKVAMTGQDAFYDGIKTGRITFDQKEIDDKLKSGDTKSIYDDLKYTYQFNPEDYKLKENKMSKSSDLKELLEEAVAGIPSIGNPFADRTKSNYESKFEAFLAEDKDVPKNPTDPKDHPAAAAFTEEEVKKEEKEPKKEQKEPKKEGRMKYDEVLKEAERLGEIAKKKVAERIYERAIAERKKAMSINEDEALSEFINQEAIKEVEKEIKELEKKLMEVAADKNTMTGGK